MSTKIKGSRPAAGRYDRTALPGPPRYRRIFIALAGIAMGLYPFFVRITVRKVPELEQVFFATHDGTVLDVSQYCKETALIVIAVCTLLYFAGEQVFPDKRYNYGQLNKRYLTIAGATLGLYALLAVISSICAKSPLTSLLGVNSDYEGVLALLSYIVIFFLGLMYYDTDYAHSCLKLVCMAMMAVADVLAGIEYLVRPILTFPFMKYLIASEELRPAAATLVSENFTGQVALAFCNPGYLGAFCVLMIPIGFGITLDENVPAKKVIYGLITAFMAGPLLGASSTAARICVSAGVILTVIAHIIKSKYNKTSKTVQTLGRYMLTTAVVAAFSVGIFVGFRALRIAIHGEYSPETAASVRTGKYRLDKMELVNGELIAYSGSSELHVILPGDGLDDRGYVIEDRLIFTDGSTVLDKSIPSVIPATSITEEMQAHTFADERFKNVSYIALGPGITLDFGYAGLVQMYADGKGFHALGQGGALLDTIPQPLVTGFERFYGFATGRGYTWIQTLPLLKKCVFIGLGPGNFPFSYNQYEMVGMLNTHGSCRYVAEKVHNWYLQIATSSGIVSLICVLSLFIIYIVLFIVKFIRTCRGGGNVSSFECGVFIALITFMLSGMINDSNVTVNPWFWLLLGSSYGRLIREAV